MLRDEREPGLGLPRLRVALVAPHGPGHVRLALALKCKITLVDITVHIGRFDTIGNLEKHHFIH